MNVLNQQLFRDKDWPELQTDVTQHRVVLCRHMVVQLLHVHELFLLLAGAHRTLKCGQLHA
jgi:hypothetical protein